MGGTRAIGAWLANLLVPVVGARREGVRPASAGLDLEPFALRNESGELAEVRA